jgi:AraC-like DNA-binding protein
MFSSKTTELPESVGIQSLTIILLDRIEDAAFLANDRGEFTYANSSASNLLNCSMPDLLTMRINDLPLASLPQIWSERQSNTTLQQTAICFVDSFYTLTTSELPVEITIGYEQEYCYLLIHPVKTVLEDKRFTLPSIPQLDPVFQFIEENYAQSISLKDVAAALGYCPSYLTDLVRRCSGQTVNHWIIKRRIALACNLLQETNKSVNQIAIATGYHNEGHFFRQFRQHCGMTPLNWRKSQQKVLNDLTVRRRSHNHQ